MREAPKRIWIDVAAAPESHTYVLKPDIIHDREYVPASEADETRRQRNRLLEAADMVLTLNTAINLQYLAGRVEEVRKAMAACEEETG